VKNPIVTAQGLGRGRDAELAPERPEHAWAVLGWIGIVFLAVGGVDFALTWYPTAFGNREWEFGTVTQSFNGLPILVLGIGLVSAAGGATRARWWGLVATAAAVGVLLCVMIGFLLWVRSVPLALATVPVELGPGVRKAVWKTSIQALAYAAVSSYLIVRSWSAFRAPRPGR
jgi:hypothetical protein